MEDVVLHYQPGSAAGLESLLETTQKLLEPFPCRTPPVFTCWFPAAADRRLPIRPAKPAPVIPSSDDRLASSHSKPTAATKTQPQNNSENRNAAETRHESPRKRGVSETPNQICRPPAEKQANKDSPVRRSWSVFTQREALLQSAESMSKRFRHVVSVHNLHLRQRAKWVIREQNCGPARDIEQVWTRLIRSVRSSGLPTCTANIQRQCAEIWVFCDVVHCEQVGRRLKDELQLSGSIGLSVRRLGHVFSV
ncbi:shieldin complex subunit 3 [Stegastes partitus]|uniref:Uncharacterized LOC103373663 n=1 Tax=Stegastes partitus TaxID=144197 RepID=A0A3B5APD2_9TELE|nr:PREDICTED: uncharacterized protein LOC103373663 [Stegastes partitus]